MMIDRARSLARRTYGRLAHRRQIAAYLGDTGSARLNLGCGYNVLMGWLNVDLEGGRHGSVFMDASRRWPLPANSFDAILCEHMIEHMPKDAGIHLFAEAFRILKPGGVIRVVTPDLAVMADLILQPQKSEYAPYLRFVGKFHDAPALSACDAVNYMFYCYGHRYIYTVDELQGRLRSAGFDEVSVGRAGHPIHEIFRGAEGHPNFMGLENDALEAFALEAVKPADRPAQAAQ